MNYNNDHLKNLNIYNIMIKTDNETVILKNVVSHLFDLDKMSQGTELALTVVTVDGFFKVLSI